MPSENSYKDIAFNNLIAGDFMLIKSMGVLIIAAGGLLLEAGTVLGRVAASGKYKVCKADAGDGSETPVAILAHDVSATEAGDSEVNVYLTGEFNINRVVLDPSITKLQATHALHIQSIFLIDSK